MRIPVNVPLLDGNEKKYLIEAIETGWISSEGPFVRRFEVDMANFVGRKFSVAVANGTAALDLAFDAIDLKPGDEVIVPAFTIISCIQHILRIGAIPIFIDCDPKTFNILPDQIENKITDRTKAILIVHIYGLTTNIDAVIKIARKHNLLVVEDAAQAIGLEHGGKQCGSFGDISTFSFYPNKHVTTGEGGMILTDNSEIYHKVKSARNLCFKDSDRFIHDSLGWNYRMTNMQAAIGVAQLERIQLFVDKKREIGATYNQLLNNILEIDLPQTHTKFCENIYWVYPLLINNVTSLHPKEIMAKLAEMGVGTRPFFYPLNLQPVLRRYNIEPIDDCPNASSAYRSGFYIPSGLGLSKDEQMYVSDAIRNVLSN